jgi:hypothetical protein
MTDQTLASVLLVKLISIDDEIERRVQMQIESLYSSSTYANGRCVEIARVLNKPGGVPADALLRVEAFIRARFDEKNYTERLNIFRDGVNRKIQSYGLEPRLNDRAFEVTNGGYRAASMNALRHTKTSVLAELALQQSSPEVGILSQSASFANDVLELKPNIMGVGINLNGLFSRLIRKWRKD